MAAYNILEARNNLSRLIASVESGLEVTITRRGRPVARLVPADAPSTRESTGARLREWFAAHPIPEGQGRSTAELDALIDENRNSWE